MNGKRGRDAGRDKIVIRDIEIVNQLGLHARPAALLVKSATKFESDVTIAKGTNSVSGKSIMGLMTLEAGQGTVLRITAEGPDAEALVDELQRLIENKFFEE
jgi:phosphocarrier protein HPr